MTDFWTVLGIWIGALATLSIWSFLYKDNPFYKFAEQIFVGVSAAYWFIFTIYNVLIPNLFDKLITDFNSNWLLLIPGLLGIMMLMKIFPKYDWLGKYPIALMIGTTAGLSLVRFLETDVINQIIATMINPLNSGSAVVAFGQVILIVGTISGLVYFYFSKKHEGFTGGVAKTGIIFLMVSFGAAFGFTAMARISLLIGRLQFLLGDWLGLLR
ncbi:MAG: hypothetical protein FWG98_01595 [Candidatus Cloacimonetes bacterium]|nr:hypothetical protein [Candidatus Cloacimonadota bacterium]